MTLTDGSIKKKLFLFSLPIVCSGLLQLLFNVADLVVCGQFGSQNSVGAISATTSLIYLIINLFLGLGVGTNVCIGHAYGAKNKEKATKTVESAMALAFLSSIFLAIIGYVFAKTFLSWMGTPDDIIDLSTTYMQIYFLSIPSMLVYNFGSALLRGMGDTKRPFYYLTIAGGMNYGLNIIFVRFGGMDVAGVAYATLITQTLSALAVLITLMYGGLFASFRFKTMRFYKEETLEIIKVGLPAGIQGAMFSISNVIIQSSINSFGSYADTGNGAGASIESFVGQGMDGFCQAGVAFVAANRGAKNIENIKKSVLWSFIYGALATIVWSGIALILRESLITVYTRDPKAIEVGTTRILINCSTYLLFMMTDEFASVERGMGYSMAPMVVSLIGICGLRIVYIYTIFPLPAYHTLTYLYYTFPISWAVTVLAHFCTYLVIRKKVFQKIEAANKLSLQDQSQA
ncbi:MAG: MATE family efflux transporter [Bacilli bacterium]|nr:MATE family efflux transporter [Bacilli bacterium]